MNIGPCVHTRPIPERYSIQWDWQACAGHDPIAPPRPFYADALNDLPAAAKLEFRQWNGSRFEADTMVEPYRIRPVHTAMHNLMISALGRD